MTIKNFLKTDLNFSKVKDFSSRVIELSQYLDEVLKVDYEDKGAPIKVTWHSNCHALRVQKAYKQARILSKN